MVNTIGERVGGAEGDASNKKHPSKTWMGVTNQITKNQ